MSTKDCGAANQGNITRVSFRIFVKVGQKQQLPKGGGGGEDYSSTLVILGIGGCRPGHTRAMPR